MLSRDHQGKIVTNALYFFKVELEKGFIKKIICLIKINLQQEFNKMFNFTFTRFHQFVTKNETKKIINSVLKGNLSFIYFRKVMLPERKLNVRI